jgi:PHD finger-like domain-containing protein 5A
MAKHHTDLVFCRKQPGIGKLLSSFSCRWISVTLLCICVDVAIGRLCEKHDGICVICDSYVRPHVMVHICDECNYGSFEGRCIICGNQGVADAYYCRACTLQEKDVSRC